MSIGRINPGKRVNKTKWYWKKHILDKISSLLLGTDEMSPEVKLPDIAEALKHRLEYLNEHVWEEFQAPSFGKTVLKKNLSLHQYR